MIFLLILPLSIAKLWCPGVLTCFHSKSIEYPFNFHRACIESLFPSVFSSEIHRISKKFSKTLPNFQEKSKIWTNNQHTLKKVYQSRGPLCTQVNARRPAPRLASYGYWRLGIDGHFLFSPCITYRLLNSRERQRSMARRASWAHREVLIRGYIVIRNP
jgi:hypothetical protein